MRTGLVQGASTHQNLLGKVQLLCKQRHIFWLLCKYIILSSMFIIEFKCTFLSIFVPLFIVYLSFFHRYEGSIGPASCAMAAADQLTAQLGRKNL